MSLQSALNEIKSLLPFVDEDVDSGPIETLSARRGRKRNAVETIDRLKREYVRDLLNSTVFIVLTGSERESFAKFANYENTECFHAKADHYYNDLVDRINPALFGRETVPALFGILARNLEYKSLEMDIVSYSPLVFKSHYNLPVTKKEDFLPIARQAINEQVGAEMVGIQAVIDIADQAIKVGHSAPVTAILVETDDEKLALELTNSLSKNLTKKSFLVAAGKTSKNFRQTPGILAVKDGSDESVKNVLARIKENLKRN